MDNKDTTGSGETHDKKHISILSTKTAKRRRGNITVMWLDSNINDNDEVCQYNIQQLQLVTHNILTFTDRDQCVDFLTDHENEKVFLIISGALCRRTVPYIHDISQLQTIFILCKNKTRNDQWVKHWSKIQGVFTDILPICDVLQNIALVYKQTDISFSIIDTSGDDSAKALDRLDPVFMYSQIFKEILLTIHFEEKHRIQLAEYCQKIFNDNKHKLDDAYKFVNEYHEQTPISWYTWDSFLYSMVNDALRKMDIDVIIKTGFFVADLHRHIELLHSEQFRQHASGDSFRVYRGQHLLRTDFERLIKTNGGLISFNNFLSTTKNRDLSLIFADYNIDNLDMVGILFVMTIDLSKSNSPFASVADESCFGDAEEEILFSMHTVFRISNIRPLCDNEYIFQVELKLTSDDDQHLRQLTDFIREETGPKQEGWQRLGLLLLKMGESEKALTYYEEALQIQQQSLPFNHPDLGVSYNNIGSAYLNIGEYSKALTYFEHALAIRQQSLPSNHPDLAASYNNIGGAYLNMCEYSKALSYHEKALAMKQESLPSNHPDLPMSYNNIGIAYFRMGDNLKALTYYEKALPIQQQSLPFNHPDLAASYNNIGSAYLNLGENSKALTSFQNAFAIRQQFIASNHPDLPIPSKSARF